MQSHAALYMCCTDPCLCRRAMLCLMPMPPDICCQTQAGDQLYNDGVWQTPTLKAWGACTDQCVAAGLRWAVRAADAAHGMAAQHMGMAAQHMGMAWHLSTSTLHTTVCSS